MPRAVVQVPAEEADAPRVGYLIYRVERRLRARLDRAVGAIGVSTPEYITLSILRDRDGLSNADLARWAFVTPQAMSLVLSALERRRLVRRRADPNHRRILRASLTTRGLRTLELCDRAMDVIEEDMLRGLDCATVETVRSALATCAHTLEHTRPLPEPPNRLRARSGKLRAAATREARLADGAPEDDRA